MSTTLTVNLDLLATQMNEALDTARVYMVAYRHEPEAVKATHILTLAAGVRAVCVMLVAAMRDDIKVNPHQIERFLDLQVDANKVIEDFNGAVTVMPFMRQNGASAGKENVVLGEASTPKRKVTYTGKNGPNGKTDFIPYKNLTPEQRAGRSRKLTDDDVRTIRAHFKGRRVTLKECSEVGKMYGVDKNTIYNVVARKTFDWLP